MKRSFLLGFVLFIILVTAKAQYVTIPDANFRAFLKTKYPTCFNASDMLDTVCSGKSAVSSLSCNVLSISNIEGIRYFKRLRTLSCTNNLLTALPALPDTLTSLTCSTNQLTDLGILPSSLTSLTCTTNQLTDLGILPSSLTVLVCASNKLTKLPALPATLTNLSCSLNLLDSLPTLPVGLKTLSCNSNRLTVLPSLPTTITSFDCNNNLLTSLPSLPPSLSGTFSCHRNQLTSLPTLPTAITILNCYSNKLTGLPTLPTSLNWLICDNNQLTSLPALPATLTYLKCYSNQITSLPTLPNSITEISCHSNLLTVLPTLPTSLKIIDCYNNKLTSLPVLPTTLQNLYFDKNQITTLPSLPSSLLQLVSSENPLKKLPTLPGSLTALYCQKNSLTILPELPATLKKLGCDSNNLTFIVSLPTGLQNLSCGYNPLSCLPIMPTGSKTLFVDRASGITCINDYPDSLKIYSYDQIPDYFFMNATSTRVDTVRYTGYKLKVFSKCPNTDYCNYVNIPDSNFRKYLKEYHPSCFNASDMLNIACPNILNEKYISCENRGIKDLTGIQYFTSLSSLFCTDNQISTLSMLPNSLKDLICGHNPISSIQNLPATLTGFECYGGLLTSAPTLPNTLKYLSLDSNKLVSLPAKLPDSLISFSCGYNGFTCLPKLPAVLRTLYIDSLSAIKCLPNRVDGLQVYGYSWYNDMEQDTLNLPVCNELNNSNGCMIYPTEIVFCPPVSNIFITSNITGVTYQWQIDTCKTGSCYQSLAGWSSYSNSNTSTLELNNIPSKNYDYKYMCLVDGNYSDQFSIKITNTWTGAVSTAWEVAGNWSCNIVPDEKTDVVIPNNKIVVINSDPVIRSIKATVGSTVTVNANHIITVLH